MVDAGSLDDLRHLTRTTITARLAGAPDGLARLPGVHDFVVDGSDVRLTVDTAALSPVLAALGQCGVHSLVSRPPTLEELFLRHYRSEPAVVPV